MLGDKHAVASCPGYSALDHKRASCRFSCLMRHFHPDPLLFCSATTKGKPPPHPPFCLASKFNDLSALVFEHLLPSAERVALDRSFYTKMDLRVLGVKVTNQQGPAEEGYVSLLCSPGSVRTSGGFGADLRLAGFVLGQLTAGEKNPAHGCKIYRFIVVSLTSVHHQSCQTEMNGPHRHSLFQMCNKYLW